MKINRAQIKEAILEEIDAMGLPETQQELDALGVGEDFGVTQDIKQEMIDMGLKALEELGEKMDPRFLASVRENYVEAKNAGNTKPLVSLYKFMISVPEIRDSEYFPTPEQFASLAKALAFSDDGQLAKKMQAIMLNTGRMSDTLNRIYAAAMSKSESELDMASYQDMAPDLDDGLRTPFTVKETQRLSDMDLLGGSSEESDTADQTVDPSADNAVNEERGLDLDRFAWGQAKEAPQPGVETEGQLTESRGSLIRNRYYGRY